MATTDRQATTLALAHALSAAERGLAVIPLSRTKLPALRSPHHDDHTPNGRCHGECGAFGHGVYDASTDPVRIRELFAAAPWATGYGIACGLPPHHLIGVDLDTKSGTDSSAALRELALRHLFTIPDTVVVLTPSGGRHLWLTGPPDAAVPNSGRPPRPRHRHPRCRRLPRRPRLPHRPRHLHDSPGHCPPRPGGLPAGPAPPATPTTPPRPPRDPPLGGRPRPGPRPVRPRRPRGPTEHPTVLGRLPGVRERHRPGPGRAPGGRGTEHGSHGA
ncbi:hypothetical protein RKD19_004271 [Streptomyces canus]